MKLRWIGLLIFCTLPFVAYAHPPLCPCTKTNSFLFGAIACLLLASCLATFLSERIRMPVVAGELLMGIFIGNLQWLPIPGHVLISNVASSSILSFIAELGLVILLFEVGLETHWDDLKNAGRSACTVATLGMVLPLVSSIAIMKYWLAPHESTATYLFIGAAMTATSIAITTRIFKDLNFIGTTEAKIVLGASVIDDILGMLLLSIVSQIGKTGHIDLPSLSVLFAKALIFLTVPLTIGRSVIKVAFPKLFQTRISEATTLAILIIFAFSGASLAHVFGLEPIIGAFAAGLMMEERFFYGTYHANMEPHKLIAPLNHAFVPLFFLLTGLHVDIRLLIQNVHTLGIIAALFAVAMVSKILSGYCAKKANPLIIGFGMAPRGEVGLIFAAVGNQLKVIPDVLFAVLVIVMVLTTIVSPFMIEHEIRKSQLGKKKPMFKKA